MGNYNKLKNRFEAVVIGSSAGGIKALSTVLAALPKEFPLPIIIVQHLHPDSDSYLAQILSTKCELKVKQADEKETIAEGVVYIAPPNYHLLVEEDRSFSLSIEGPVNFARPSVDVLFETAVYAYRNKIIGIILTGANNDGHHGVKKIKQIGGYVIVQEPTTAEADAMPRAAIAATKVDKILSLEQIGPYLLQLVNRSIKNHRPTRMKKSTVL
jgi:two-component system chemotaxis response regulator CheB